MRPAVAAALGVDGRRRSRAGRRALPTVLAAAALALAGCGSSTAPVSTSTTAPTSARPAPTTSAKAGAKGATTKVTAPPTTSTLGPFPPILRSSAAGVDAAAIRSLADLPAAFQCPTKPAPIQIPGSATAPPSVVCASKLAGNEALFLWYVDTPDSRYLALTEALAKARYVRGGPSWVAGGMLDAGMGKVGGDVYK